MISIITPTLNAVVHLRDALDSLAAQSGARIEHIVVDGGSVDGTWELLTTRLPARLIRCPGSSLYQALNTGLAVARGEVIGFLNADDAYLPGVLAPVADEFAADTSIDIVSGGAEVVRRQRNGADRIIARYRTEHEIALTMGNLALGVPILNARFFRPRVFSRIGRFDTRYTLAADRAFLIRAAIADPPVCHRILPLLVYRYRSHPGSLTLAGNRSRRLAIAAEHLRLSAEILSKRRGDHCLAGVMRQWHSREAAVAAWHRLAACEWTQFCDAFAAGRRHNPRFLRSAIKTLLSWGIRRSRAMVQGRRG